MIDDECESGERLVHKTTGFVSFIPYAALSPFHILLYPGLNFVIRSVFADRIDPRSYHWYLSIIPHVSSVAGFEMESGMFINPSIPEQVAKFLREATMQAMATEA